MTDDRDHLDAWLERDAEADAIVPSSGFTERVMTVMTMTFAMRAGAWRRL